MMRNTKTISTLKTSILCLFAFVSVTMQSQQKISIDDAVKIALKNNFDILVAGNDAAIDKVNNSYYRFRKLWTQ